MYSIAQLQSEIASDPAGLDLKTSGVDAPNAVVIAQILNTPANLLSPPQTGTEWTKFSPQVPIASVAQWAATPDGTTGTTPIDLLTTASTNGALSSAVRGAALMALRIFNGSFATFDVSSTANQALIAALVAAGPITAAQQAALIALGQVPCSRAEALWGVNTIVTPEDVHAAGY
jgi:hypothetical protein